MGMLDSMRVAKSMSFGIGSGFVSVIAAQDFGLLLTR
jgi:hypothetical protein